MNHAIKEQISDNTLYVEVDPQPVSGSMGGRKNWTLHQGVINFIAWSERNLIQYLVANGSPILIGDTVNGRKVVGIEVELMPTTEMVPTLTNPPVMKPVHRDKWFWKYSLEEI